VFLKTELAVIDSLEEFLLSNISDFKYFVASNPSTALPEDGT
jgi:hypothetical protein